MRLNHQQFSDLFKMQRLVLDEQDIEQIISSKIAIAGLGGIGSYLVEFLARNGFVNLNIADFDVFEADNYRQLNMTAQTLGKNKCVVTEKRVKNIFPKASIKSFLDGINISNYDEFCSEVNVVCAQTDRITSQVLLYLGAFNNKTVLVRAGRAKWPDKHAVRASVYDFRKSKGKFCLELLNINPTQWGVNDKNLLNELIKKAEKHENDQELIDSIEKQNLLYRKKSFKKHVREFGSEGISDKPKNYLKKVIKNHGDKFFEMSITPELCAVSASLVTTAVKDIVLGRPLKDISINLYHGKVYNYND